MTEAVGAEQRGDLSHALACLQRAPRPVGSSWDDELAEMVELGESAEPWQWARFTVAAAGRWVRTLPLPLVARVIREVTDAAEGADGPVFPEYPGWVAGRAALHPAVAGTLLFDELMLEVFLVQVAPVLAGRSGGGRTWADTPGRIYELVGVDGVELDVREHATGREHRIRHLGETVGLGPGDLVYGHLIDVPGEPALIFAAPPIVVDEVVAQRLERLADHDPWDLESRCAALGAAVRSGDPYHRPPIEFDDEPAPWVRELMADGLGRVDAEQLATIEAVIMACEISSGSAPSAAFHAGVALAHPQVYAEAQRRYTGSEHEALWRTLAGASHGRERARFVQLAEASRGHREAS
ncbi:hypothetical protein [Haloactinopolyspora alba]|nr:hypothetical protein [Haloactinopolyspora alba]